MVLHCPPPVLPHVPQPIGSNSTKALQDQVANLQLCLAQTRATLVLREANYIAIAEENTVIRQALLKYEPQPVSQPTAPLTQATQTDPVGDSDTRSDASLDIVLLDLPPQYNSNSNSSITGSAASKRPSVPRGLAILLPLHTLQGSSQAATQCQSGPSG